MRNEASMFATAMLPALLAAAPSQAADAICEKHSGATIAALIELYTSEGCNSCPPADRWLSTLGSNDGLIALAFHVDYWDRLGWKDRFANPSFSERQYQIQRHTGARFVYTPQLVANGSDWRGWPGAVPASPGAPQVDVRLRREGDAIEAYVAARSDAAGRWAGFWATTEDGHKSAVAAGENRGVTLLHDHVVRSYAPIPAWPASQPQTLRFKSPRVGEGGRPRRVVLVVHDAANGRTVQALALGC